MDENGVEVWRGGVATWECDSMGHLNVGFYVAKCMEGLVSLAADLGMPAAFTPTAEATLVVRDQHIRFLREARPNALLSMTGSVLEMDETEARLLFLLRHESGRLAATFNVLVAHVTAREARAFPWPDRVRRRAEALKVALPIEARPRSLDLARTPTRASRAQADALGLQRTAAGALRPAECDLFGRMRPEALMARISDCAPHLFTKVTVPINTTTGKRMGGAALEYRLVHIDPPGVGRQFEMRSAFATADPRVRRVVHWMLDRNTGRPFGVAEAIAVALDLDARKIVDLDEAAMEILRPHVVEGLTL